MPSQHVLAPRRVRASAGAVVAALALLAVGLPGVHARAAAADAPEPVVDAPTSAPGEVDVAAPRPAPPVRRIIVRWNSSATPEARVHARQQADATPVRSLADADVELVAPEPGRTMADALRALRTDPRVASAEPDQALENFGLPNDPDLPLQWSLSNAGGSLVGFDGAKTGGDIDVVPAWDRTVGTPSTVVAVLDGGYDFLNSDLGDVAWTNPGEVAGNGIDDDGDGKVDDVHGWDFVGADYDNLAEDSDPTDDDLRGGGHGLHVAGIIGARGNDGHGITGIAQDARLMPLRVCSWSAVSYANYCALSAVVAAINYAGAHGARVANLSLGGPLFSPAMVDAFAANPQTLFVVAAGNSARNNDETATYPCNYDPKVDSTVPGRVDNVICVAASDQRDRPATFTNTGPTSVDLAAPGVSIWSLYRSGTAWADDFTADNFATRWTTNDGSFGRAPAGDGKLTSPGLTDSPGAAPTAGLHRAVSAPVLVSSSVESCRVQGERYTRIGAGGAFDYSILVDGAHDPMLDFGPAEANFGVMKAFMSTPFDGTLIAGRSISFEVTYDAAAGLDATNGVWFDNLKIVCARSYAKPALYDYLSGTSMSSPMVTGGAALLFSLKPSATVAQVRSALLGSAKRLAEWKGKTSTGGRLDIAAALGRLVPPGTAFSSTPTVSGQRITAALAQTGTLNGIRFQCRIDTRPFESCGSLTTRGGLHPGRHIFFGRAVDPYGNVDLSPAAYSFTVTGCLVPRMVGSSPARVAAVLPRSGCAVGRVIRPAGVAFRLMRVKATYPRAGSYRPTGTKVTIVLVRR